MTNLLVLGGTQWLGRTIAIQARDRGIAVTCLARGVAGDPAEGIEFVAADRSMPTAYDAVRGRDWDAVVDVSWQPPFVAGAVAALGERTAHWTYVSSGSVYARTDIVGSDESSTRHAPLRDDAPTWETYGPAKAACEDLVVAGLGERAFVARAGLIGGPGDPSDRFGYWVSRFALADDETVLVPDAPDLSSQLIDVRDLADWIVSAPSLATSGPFNACGEAMPFPVVIAEAAAVAGFRGEQVLASPTWLAEHEVAIWSGPRSLPLWMNLPEYAGFNTRSDARALGAGLVRRSLVETIEDTLADERARGLARPRKAGLDRADELELIRLLPAKES